MSHSGSDRLDDKTTTPILSSKKVALASESVDSSSDSNSESNSGSDSSPSKVDGSKDSTQSESGSSSDDERSSKSSNTAQQFETPNTTLNRENCDWIDFSQIGDVPVTVASAGDASTAAQAVITNSTATVLEAAQLISPIVTTPGKSMTIQVSSASVAGVAPLSVNPSTTSGNPVTQIPSDQSLHIDNSSATTVAAAPVSVLPPVIVQATSSSANAMASTPKVAATPSADTKSDKTSSVKHGMTSDQRKALRYQKKLAKMERDIIKSKKARADKAVKKAKKGDKQPRKHKKKAKKAPPPEASSDDLGSGELSSSSTSTPPGPSDRIAKISKGRKLQQLSMARVKELGLLRNSDLCATQITEALKIIDLIELDINPEQAYPLFHRVPGTGLPHMKKFYQDFSLRYSTLVRSIVKFHLLQAQKLYNARVELVRSDADNPYFPMWQFRNDLAWAPATTTHLQAPPLDDICESPEPKKPRTSSTLKSAVAPPKAAKKSKDKGSKKKAAAELVLLAESIIKKAKGSKKKKKKQEVSSSSEVQFC